MKTRQLMALFLSTIFMMGTTQAYTPKNVDIFGDSGDELVYEMYDTHINFSNVNNEKVFTWPSQGTVLVYTNTTVLDTLKKSINKLDGMVIPAGLIVDFYHDCGVLNSEIFPTGYQFIAQYDTTDGKPDTVNAQELMYEFDRAFGTHMANSTTTKGVPFHDFYDVRATDYFANAVAWALEENITNGTSSDAFSPKGTVTRAQAVTFLWRAAGSPEPTSSTSPFIDVSDPTQYYYKAVLWAVEKGITTGVSATSFAPNTTLAYDQIFTFLSRVNGDTIASSDWSAAAMQWAEKQDLIDGHSVQASSGCPRADVVYFMWKQMIDIDEQPDPNHELSSSEEDMLRDLLFNSMLEQKSVVDVSEYYISEDTLIAIAEEIADMDVDSPFYVNQLKCKNSNDGYVLTLNIGYSVTFDGGITNVFNGSVIPPLTPTSTTGKSKAMEVIDQYITPDMSDYEIAKTLHDYLVLNCEYDMRLYSGSLPYVSYTAAGPLIHGTAVCEGYAKAYKLLLDEVGIPCEYVSGYGNGGRHGWNIVQIDGEWYHVDTTWDDPVPNRDGYVRYDYFLVSDNVMSRDHSDWTSKYPCTSTKYDNQNLPDIINGENSEESDTQIQDDFNGLIPSNVKDDYREIMTPIYETLISAGQNLSGKVQEIDISEYSYRHEGYVKEAIDNLNKHSDYGSQVMYCNYNSDKVFVYERTYAETTIQSYLDEIEQAVAEHKESYRTSKYYMPEQLAMWYHVKLLLMHKGYTLGNFVVGEDFTIGITSTSGDDINGWSYYIQLNYNN